MGRVPESAGADHEKPLQVLAVCTANQCRSPLIEFALRRRCRSLGLGWEISSAGTAAILDRPPHPYVQRLLSRHGDDYGEWRSRLLNLDLIESADLILTAAAGHRRQVASIQPLAMRRTFPALQFAAFCEALPEGLRVNGDSPGSLREQIRGAREQLPPSESSSDLPDPVGLSFRAFRRLDRLIESAADAILGVRWS